MQGHGGPFAITGLLFVLWSDDNVVHDAPLKESNRRMKSFQEQHIFASMSVILGWNQRRANNKAKGSLPKMKRYLIGAYNLS